MEFDRAVAELDALVATLEREGDERALMLLELIDAIHRPALELILAGEREHPISSAVLAMYELDAPTEELLVEEALDEVRPYIESHGGSVELLEVAGGTVHVQMSGACHGCAASAMTLRRGIETAIRERFPALVEVVAHAPDGAPETGAAGGPLLQIENATQLRRPRFVEIEADGLGPGEMAARDADGIDLLLVNVDGDLYAFKNGCAVDGRALDQGRLSSAIVICPWHNCAYDARSGRRVDDEAGDSLAVVPIAVDGDGIRVAVNVL